MVLHFDCRSKILGSIPTYLYSTIYVPISLMVEQEFPKFCIQVRVLSGKYGWW